LENFEAVALELARDGSLLQSLRSRLQQNRVACPLFDIDRFRSDIEKAYIRMVEAAAAGQAPMGFDVS